ncbi:EAL domain-containing protein (plasmid) [Vibrio alginolyticus]|uniref:EAL domain-containing protein n=1 Tax=Vibrio alginolyticus TaxID=663 RepID=UPI0015946FDF|nr:EAL domain-containing protein [Vibrio alginolyticus]QKS98632.1 EAL domain-containing protein [Vibrio alginolyticus]
MDSYHLEVSPINFSSELESLTKPYQNKSDFFFEEISFNVLYQCFFNVNENDGITRCEIFFNNKSNLDTDSFYEQLSSEHHRLTRFTKLQIGYIINNVERISNITNEIWFNVEVGILEDLMLDLFLLRFSLKEKGIGLVLEITERNYFLLNMSAVNALKANGFTLAGDDFNKVEIEYFGFIKYFDYIKVEDSHNFNPIQFIKMLKNFSNNVDLRFVIERCSYQYDLTMLEYMGVHYLQGFEYHKPSIL